MSDITPKQSSAGQVYLTGISIGALFGLIAAYLYARSTSEVDRERIRTTEIISLTLAGLGLMRQITEVGKKK